MPWPVKGKMPIADASEQVGDWQIMFPVVAADGQALTRAINTVQCHKDLAENNFPELYLRTEVI